MTTTVIFNGYIRVTTALAIKKLNVNVTDISRKGVGVMFASLRNIKSYGDLCSQKQRYKTR